MELDDLQEIIGHVAREKKTKLDLSNKDISVLPAEIGNLIHLKELNLSYNNLTVLPPELFKLKRLETVLLLRNDILEIPGDVGQLVNLRTLDISHNPIKSLPEEFGNLTNLQTLDASYCNMKRLPVSFINLLCLKNLYLENNSFEFPPDKIVKRGLYATMHYLTEEKSKHDSARVMMQVFNMPAEIQVAFKQYIECFKEMVDAGEKKDISIGINFLNKKDDEDIDVETGAYILEFVKFVRENTASFMKDDSRKNAVNLLDFQVLELRNQLAKLNDSLNEKMNEIKDIHQELTSFAILLDTKIK